MRRQLRCYLVRDGVTPQGTVTPTGVEKARAFEALPPEPATEVEFTAIAAPSDAGTLRIVTFSGFSSPPWWHDSLGEELPLDDFVLGQRPSRGALIFCAVADPDSGAVRWVVWTFGTGSQYLDRTRLDPRFGVIVALNRLMSGGGEEALLRKLQYRQQGAFRQRVGHVAATDTPLGGFRIDQIRDLVAAAGGQPAGEEAQVFGARNFVYRTAVETLFETLPTESWSVFAEYQRDTYRDHFGFIDNYIPLDDPEVVEVLDAIVLHAIRADSPTVEAWYPDDLVDFNDERVIEFVLLPGEHLNVTTRKTFTVELTARAIAMQPDAGLDARVRFADAERNELASVRVRDCISADFEHDGQRYCLADGTLYEVDPDFIGRINDRLLAVPEWRIEELPRYGGGSEAGWLETVASDGPFAVLDKHLIYVPGSTAFEAADLVHVSGAMLHVKRAGRSSALSYLFVQASTSAEMLGQPEAVEQLRAHVDAHAPKEIVGGMQEALRSLDNMNPDLDVVITILSDRGDTGVHRLPLIAKLELDAQVSAIRRRGFKPHLVFVPSAARP